jgi:hypothetical protein
VRALDQVTPPADTQGAAILDVIDANDKSGIARATHPALGLGITSTVMG